MVDRYSSECTELCHFPNDKCEWVHYSDYEALEAKLDALLIGLQVKEIPELKTKSPEHFAKLAECIADDSQEKAAKIMHLEAKLAALVDELKHMAKQKLESEMPEDEREDADYRTGYDCLVRIARVLVATAAKVTP